MDGERATVPFGFELGEDLVALEQQAAPAMRGPVVDENAPDNILQTRIEYPKKITRLETGAGLLDRARGVAREAQ